MLENSDTFDRIVDEDGQIEGDGRWEKARNERVKLDATFLNNLAVGLVLAGIFLPLFSLFRSTPDEILPFVFSVTGVLAIAGAFMIFWAAYQFSQGARKEIAKIED